MPKLQARGAIAALVCGQVELPDEIRAFIQESTGNYGKVKLVLHRNKFWVESPYPDILRTLLKVTPPGWQDTPMPWCQGALLDPGWKDIYALVSGRAGKTCASYVLK